MVPRFMVAVRRIIARNQPRTDGGNDRLEQNLTSCQRMFGRIEDVKPRLGRQCLFAALMTVVVSLSSVAADTGGFYVRAGLGVDRTEETVFSDQDCSNVSPAALYGCGTGGDGAPYRSVGDFGTSGAVEFGVGRVIASPLRLEVRFDYRPHLAFRGRANFLDPPLKQSVQADLSALSALLAVHADLPAFDVSGLGPLMPFVGAGAGVVRTKIGETRMTFPRTTTTVRA